MAANTEGIVPDESPRISGVWVAGGLLLLGAAFTLVLWLYTEVHTGPFRDLRDAIHSEFPRSVPQVEGGQKKMHKGTPRILRITLQVHSDPREDDQLVTGMIDRLVSLSEEHHGLGGYDVLDVYLVWFRPEQKAVSRHEQREVRQLVEAGLVTPASD
jgi:hypothetical protein